MLYVVPVTATKLQLCYVIRKKIIIIMKNNKSEKCSFLNIVVLLYF